MLKLIIGFKSRRIYHVHRFRVQGSGVQGSGVQSSKVQGCFASISSNRFIFAKAYTFRN
jgi:hypothetical protein